MLSVLRGKTEYTLVVVCVRAGSPQCTKQLEEANEAFEAFQERGCGVLGTVIASDAALQSWTKPLKLKFPVVQIAPETLASVEAYKGKSATRSWLLMRTKTAEVVAKNIGFRAGVAYTQAALESLNAIAEKTPPPTKKRNSTPVESTAASPGETAPAAPAAPVLKKTRARAARAKPEDAERTERAVQCELIAEPPAKVLKQSAKKRAPAKSAPPPKAAPPPRAAAPKSRK